MKKVIIFALLLMTLFISYVLLSYILAARYVEVKDQDLIYYPQKIDDNKNAYIVLLPTLRQIKNQQLYTETESLPKGEKDVDLEVARKLVKKDSSILPILSKSLTLDSFQVPQMQYAKEVNPERFTKELLFLYKLAFLNIRVLIDEGNLRAAEQEIEKFIKYGHLLQNSEGGMIYTMIGTSVKDRALDLVQEWTFKSTLDANYYKHLLEVIEKYSDNSGIANSLRIEYTTSVNLLRNFVEDTIKDNPEYNALFERYKKNPAQMRFLYNENATVNESAKYYRQEIANLNGPYSDIKHKSDYSASLISGNPMGKLLLQIVQPRFDSIIKRKFKLAAKFNLTKLLLALKAYYTDKNSLPSALEELVPTYIKTIPTDPFDNKSLKYSKLDKIIYSVDSDMKDEHGNKEKDLCLLLNF